MNINALKDYIDQFNLEIITSGFKRDLQDFVTSMPNNQNNIVALRDLALKISIWVDEVYNSDLPENLEMLLVEKVKPFTSKQYNENFKELISDKEIDISAFFQKLNKLMTQLNNEIQKNIAEIDKIDKFIEPYIDTQEEILTEDEKAIISIIFKDKKTITDLKEFTKNLQNWNKILLMYHQVLSSSSPEDIKIVNVQNGSIDVLVNLNVDLALDLAEVFEYGYKAFLAYLGYKKLAKPIIEGYLGNQKLIAGEKTREKELINNIGEAVKFKITEQHSEAVIEDKKIDPNSDKRIEQVVKLVTSHILKGNDFKILALPEVEDTEEDEVSESNPSEELKKISMQVKQAVKSLPEEEMKKLLERYSEPDTTEEK